MGQDLCAGFSKNHFGNYCRKEIKRRENRSQALVTNQFAVRVEGVGGFQIQYVVVFVSQEKRGVDMIDVETRDKWQDLTGCTQQESGGENALKLVG